MVPPRAWARDVTSPGAPIQSVPRRTRSSAACALDTKGDLSAIDLSEGADLVAGEPRRGAFCIDACDALPMSGMRVAKNWCTRGHIEAAHDG